MNKSSTVIVLNKHVKSITPIKSGAVQRTARNEPSITPREKVLMKQNIELKKENAELIKLLKKSKDLIKDEIGKCRAENQAMKAFVEAAWPITEGKIEEKLRDQVKSIIGMRSSNTIATNHTERMSSEPQSTEPNPSSKLTLVESEEIASLKHKLVVKDKQNKFLQAKISDAKSESKSVIEYLSYVLKRKRISVENDKMLLSKEVLPVDSANVGSEGDEDDKDELGFNLTKVLYDSHNKNNLLPGFIKSLMLKNDLISDT